MPLPRRLAPALPALLVPLATMRALAQVPADTTAGAPLAADGVSVWIPLAFLLLTLAVAVALAMRWSDLGVGVMRGLVGVGALALFLTGLTAGMWALGRTARTGALPGPGATWGVDHWLVVGLAALTVAFLLMFVVDSRRQPIVLESHWGGFGGGLGGIRVPSALVYLIAALGFGTMLTVLSERLPRAVVVEQAASEEAGEEAADSVAPVAADSAAADSLTVAAGEAEPEESP